MRTLARSPYMEFAKLRSGARYNLATSGMDSLPLADLGLTIADLEINGDNPYGYLPLKQAIAARYRVPLECVVTATGTSMANYLALAASANPGERILVEEPTYEPILRTAEYLDFQIDRFRRDDTDFSIDLADLERNLTPQTRLIVLCNLHNPSGQLTSDDTLRQIGELARASGAKVLVDEVYREMLWESVPQSAFHLDPETFLSTNSLTKAYGLSGIRCGWILAAPEHAERMCRINDLHGSTPAHPTELIGARAFDHLAEIAAKQCTLLDANRLLLRDFLDSHPDLDCYRPAYGTMVAPRLKKGSVDELAELFRNKFNGSFVPGRFFESPDRLRLGVGLPTSQISDSLHQLSLCLSTA